LDAGALQRLLDEADCRALILRYGPAVDWRDRAVLETLFWPDAEVDLGVFKGRGSEAPDFLMQNTSHSLRRWHVTSSLSLRVEGGCAYAESCAMTHAITGGGEAGMMSHMFIGRYLDRLERRQAEWRIASRRYLLHHQVSEDYVENPAFDGMSKADDLSPAHPFFPRPGFPRPGFPRPGFPRPGHQGPQDAMKQENP